MKGCTGTFCYTCSHGNGYSPMRQGRSKRQSSKKFFFLLVVQVLVGVGLACFTYAVLGVFKDTAESEAFGWLSISGAGVGSSVVLMGLLAFAIGADIFWFIFFLLWLLKQKMHLKSPDNTLHLP